MNIGFMQGRLCDQVNGKIQSFPWRDWQNEFPIAERLGIRLMEWTLDQERLHENPLMREAGRKRIKELSEQHGVQIQSLTGDCFMQAPFFKVFGKDRTTLMNDLQSILDASASLGLRFILIPLVDNGSLVVPEQEVALIEGLLPLHSQLVEQRMKIIFESDFTAQRLASFIEQFPADAFGINYDIGNSAALGYLASEEISRYGQRIDNVHIKDRMLHGITVPLGTGNAEFPAVFSALRDVGFNGNFILQTARDEAGNHAGAIARYRDMTLAWWNDSGT